MEQKENSNYQETVVFGKANIVIEPFTSDDCDVVTLPSGVRSSSTGIFYYS